jgi:hypothetical protein
MVTVDDYCIEIPTDYGTGPSSRPGVVGTPDLGSADPCGITFTLKLDSMTSMPHYRASMHSVFDGLCARTSLP